MSPEEVREQQKEIAKVVRRLFIQHFGEEASKGCLTVGHLLVYAMLKGEEGWPILQCFVEKVVTGFPALNFYLRFYTKEDHVGQTQQMSDLLETMNRRIRKEEERS